MRRRRLMLTATGFAAVAGTALFVGHEFQALNNTRSAVRRLGLLGFGTNNTASLALLRASLHNYGWTEGQNLVIMLRDPDPPSADPPAYVDLVSEFVRWPADVIATINTGGAVAALQVTREVPVVFEMNDPVGRGVVSSVAHPGGNATGVNNLNASGLVRKRLEWLGLLVPGLNRIGFLMNSTNPISAGDRAAVQEAAPSLGIEVKIFDVPTADRIDPVFAEVAAWPADGVLLEATQPLNASMTHIGQLAIQLKMPVEAWGKNNLFPGILGFYAAQEAEVQEIAARKIDQILRGANPGDLPVEEPTQFDFVLSRSTVQVLGLSISPDVARQVTEWVD